VSNAERLAANGATKAPQRNADISSNVHNWPAHKKEKPY
jgi:hypothetical protein